MYERIRCVLFDVGGVLVDWNPEHLYRTVIPSADERNRFLTDCCNYQWNHELNLGADVAGAIDEKVRRYPDFRLAIEAYYSRWIEMVPNLVPGIMEIVSDLTRAGLPLHLVTNSPVWAMPKLRARYPIFENFESTVTSGEHGVAKPDPKLLAIAHRRTGVAREQLLLIDDRAENVESAQRMGVRGVIFTTAKSLREELYRLRVLDSKESGYAEKAGSRPAIDDTRRP
ncbi:MULTISPECIES: HAD family hydrolase [Streptomyces]|nr:MULTISPECIES: HAD family phosphatase [Streptomyces]